MKISVLGVDHLAATLRAAATVRGVRITDDAHDANLIFIADDVLDHSDASQLQGVALHWHAALQMRRSSLVPIVIVSQVAPGWVRQTLASPAYSADNVFYQVDTIIVDRAVERTTRPEQFVVGCVNPAIPLPIAYQAYLAAHGPCPVLKMSYEAAELVKCAINYTLAAQIEAANVLATVAKAVGADYADVERALRNDARIGQHTYLRPGQPNQHLCRDIDTITKIMREGRD